nr:PLAT domain-containing protein 3-like [Ipomoea batatas]
MKAGTDSIITLTLYDADGYGVRINNLEEWGGLMGEGYDYFERGNLDIFSGRGPCLSAPICYMNLTSDGTGKNHGWYCNYVEVTVTGVHQACSQQLFTVEQWLATDTSPYTLTAIVDNCISVRSRLAGAGDAQSFPPPHLNETSTAAPPSIYQLLSAYGLPMGLFPEGILDFYLDNVSGHFELRLSHSCAAEFETPVWYDVTVSGTLSYGQISDLSGVAAQELFLWLPVKSIRVDIPSSGLIYFDVGVVNKQFSLSFFETPRVCTFLDNDEAPSWSSGDLVSIEDLFRIIEKSLDLLLCFYMKSRALSTSVGYFGNFPSIPRALKNEESTCY